MALDGEDEEFFHGILQSLGENPQREGLVRTPERFLSALREMAGAQRQSQEDLAAITFQAEGYDNWVCLCDVPFGSLCEHHMLPFSGKISMAYWPRNGRVVGLSKLLRFADRISHRLQLQEQLTVTLASSIFKQLNAKAVAVRVEAEHSCISLRGVRKPGVRAITTHRCGNADYWPF